MRRVVGGEASTSINASFKRAACFCIQKLFAASGNQLSELAKNEQKTKKKKKRANQKEMLQNLQYLTAQCAFVLLCTLPITYCACRRSFIYFLVIYLVLFCFIIIYSSGFVGCWRTPSCLNNLPNFSHNSQCKFCCFYL